MLSAIRYTAIVAFIAVFFSVTASGQAFPPGTFSIDGYPVYCGMNVTILAPNLRDVGMNDGRGHIYVNPYILGQQPTPLKLFWYAHECGHSVVGASESDADCWAIKTGKKQGWFPESSFRDLMIVFANNPGDWTHLPGPARWAHIRACYGDTNHDDDDDSDSSSALRTRRSSDDGSADRRRENLKSCHDEYSSCISELPKLHACVEEKHDSCMSDCDDSESRCSTKCANYKFVGPCEDDIREQRKACRDSKTDCEKAAQEDEP